MNRHRLNAAIVLVLLVLAGLVVGALLVELAGWWDA